jgi:hypothetical protein
MSDEMISATVNSDRHGRQIAALHNALIGTGGDASTVIHSESRLLCKQVMNLTPTPGLGQDAKKRGEESVKKDLMKLFTPVTDGVFEHVVLESSVTGIDGWLTQARHASIMNCNGTDLTQAATAWRHSIEPRQDRRGARSQAQESRVGKWKAAYVVSFQDFDSLS